MPATQLRVPTLRHVFRPAAPPPPRRRYFGFFGTLVLPIDIAEAYWYSYENVTNVTEVRACSGGAVSGTCAACSGSARTPA